MQKKFSQLRSLSFLIVLIPTILILLIARLYDDPQLIYLPWLCAPFLGLAAFYLWLPHGMLPPAPPAYTPPPLLIDGAFALSGAQFFPIRDDYTENPPHPPARPKLTRAWILAWLTMALGVLGCLVPFFCVWASFLSVTLASLNPAGFASSREDRPMPIRRLTLLAFCLGLAGVWSAVLILILTA